MAQRLQELEAEVVEEQGLRQQAFLAETGRRHFTVEEGAGGG